MIQSFLCNYVKKFFSHVSSNDLRVKIALKGVIFMTSKDALESSLTNMTMLVLLPKDSKEANVLFKHIQRQVHCSNNKSAALVLLSSKETNECLLKDFIMLEKNP